MITTLDSQSWAQELLTGNADFIRDPSGTLWVISNVRPSANNFIILQSLPSPPQPGPGFVFTTVGSYTFPVTNTSFDPVVAYDATGGNPLLQIIGTQNNPADPRLVDLVKFSFDTITQILTGPTVLITGSDIREAYDLLVLNNAVTGGGIHHKMIAVGVDNALAPPLFVSAIQAINVVGNVLTVTTPNIYAPGQLVTLSGLTNATFLNSSPNNQVNVSTATPSQFTAVYTYPNPNAPNPGTYGGVITIAKVDNANTLTITGTNTLNPGDQVFLSGLTVATFLNGQTVTVGTASSTQFTAPFTHGVYGPANDTGIASVVDTGSITPNFTGETLISFELNSGDAVTGPIQTLANSPLRSGNTFSSVSLITPDAVNVEVYWESHPKIINFKDQFFTVNQTNRLGTTPITATSITSNVLTVTAANNYVTGNSVTLTGTAEGFLNGQTVTVVTSTPTQFTAAFTHANYTNVSDTGSVVATPPIWDAATTQLTQFQGRYSDNRLTAVFDANGNRYLSQNYYTQTNHPEGLTGNLILGYKPATPANTPWLFHTTLGSAVSGSIVQSSISVAANGSVNLTYLTEPFQAVPPPLGLPASFQFHVGSVDVSTLAVTDVPGFYNTLNFTWLRGSKSTIDNGSLWAAVGEREVTANASETFLIPAVAPYVLQVSHSATFWQNTSVVDTSGTSARPYTQVGNAPVEGQYAVDNRGTYEFAMADASVGITGISLVGNVLTVSGSNISNLSIGMTVMFGGLTSSTYLNGQTVMVNQINVLNGTFGGTFTHADDIEHADTGLTGRPISISYVYISQIIPVYISLFNVPPVARLMPDVLTTVYRAQPLALSAATSTDADQDPLSFVFTENDPDLANITLNSSGSSATLNVSKAIGGNQQAHITNVALTTNVATLTAINTFSTGQIVLFKNLVGAAFLNGQILAIQSASGTQFTVNFTHANYSSAADNGDAGVYRNFSVGVAVTDLFPDLTTPRHPADPVTAVHVTSASTAVITAINTLGTGQQAMAYSIALAPPATPTFTAPVASGVSAGPITNVTVSVTGFLTVVANNNLVAGQQVTFSGLTNATFLNGQTVTVADANATQFDATTAFSTYGPAAEATGAAQYPPATTYFAKTTYINPVGESQASAEGSTSCGVGFLPVVVSPAASGDATGYRVYMSLTTGTEGLQTTTAPITLGTDYPLPVAGVLSGSPVPAINTAFLEVLSDQALTVSSATGTTVNVTGVFNPTSTPVTAVTGFLMPQFQFDIATIQVPFNAIPTITFPAPAWSPGPEVSVARNKLITITPGTITDSAVQFPVVITGANDNDDATSYLWTQIAGTPVVFTTGVVQPLVSFDTNGVDVHGEALTFQLEINDGVNPPVTATCTINVAAYNFVGLDTLRLSRSIWSEVTDINFVQVGPTALSLNNIVTIVAPNEFTSGLTVTFANLTGATFLNNQSITVGSSITSPVVSTITNVQRSGTLVTLTATNQISPGQVVTVAAVTSTAVNGTFVVLTSTGTQLTYNTVTSGSIGPVADTGTVTLLEQFTGFFNEPDYPLAADFGDATSPARIALRNESHVWGDLDISAMFSNLSTIKRTSVNDGTDRYIVISPFTVLVYGGINPNSVLLRKLFTPNKTGVLDAVHTEDDATLVLDGNSTLYRYSTAPLINTDNPDTTINLAILSSMQFTNITATASFANIRVIALSGPDGCMLLQVTNDTLTIQNVLELTVADNLLFGANQVQFIRTAGVESLRTGKVLLGTVISAQATVTKVQVTSNALSLTCDNSFFVGDDIHLSGFTGPTAFLNGVRITVITASPTKIVGSLQTADSALTSSNGQAISDTDGTTYETLIDLPHGQIIGTWDSSKLRNQYVNTGEILFEPDSTYSGHPIPPVQHPPSSLLTPNGTQVTIIWTQERPDLVTSYGVEYSQIITDNTMVPVSLQVQAPNSGLFGQDLGVVDVSGFGTITAVQITSNVLTVTAANNFSAGNIVTISNLTTATFLNNQVVTVLTASGTHFTAAFTHVDTILISDSGLATAQINHALVNVPNNISPGPGQYTVNVGTYTFNSAQQGDSIVITFSTNFQLLQNVNSGAVQKLVLIMPGGSYQFRIRAFSSDGISGYSNLEQPISF